MKIKKPLTILLIITVIFISLCILIVRLLSVPKQESENSDLTKFKSADINLSSNNSGFLYSFIPDGSGIIYIEDVKKGSDYEAAKYLFYYLDFKSGKQEKIHEVAFHEDFRGEAPFIYWLDRNLSLLGGQIYLGLCGSENLNGTVLFNLETKEKKLISCVTRSRTEDSKIYFQNFLQFYTDYSKNKQFYNIFKVKYSTQYSNTSYVFVSNNYPIYLFGNYLDDRVYSEEKLVYDEFDRKSLGLLVNKEIQTQEYPHIYDERINSRDRKYYFILKNVDYLGCAAVDCDQKQYLEVYDSNDKLVRKLYLGKIGMGTIGPKYTGYVDFWSNDNKIVLIKNTGTRNQFRIYFIDPEN